MSRSEIAQTYRTLVKQIREQVEDQTLEPFSVEDALYTAFQLGRRAGSEDYKEIDPYVSQEKTQ